MGNVPGVMLSLSVLLWPLFLTIAGRSVFCTLNTSLCRRDCDSAVIIRRVASIVSLDGVSIIQCLIGDRVLVLLVTAGPLERCEDGFEPQTSPTFADESLERHHFIPLFIATNTNSVTVLVVSVLLRRR